MAETLIASEIVKLGALVKEKIAAGNHIYNYTIGDFDSKEFPIPEELKDNIINDKRVIGHCVDSPNDTIKILKKILEKS